MNGQQRDRRSLEEQLRDVLDTYEGDRDNGMPATDAQRLAFERVREIFKVMILNPELLK